MGVKVSLENPRRSYMWDFFLDRRPDAVHGQEVHFSACRFGAPYKKDTTVRCWNWVPKMLAKTCVLSDGVFSCGRSAAQGHEVLEFGGRSTHEAAEYAPGVCEVWALDVANALVMDTTPGRPLSEVKTMMVLSACPLFSRALRIRPIWASVWVMSA